jgi:hypothetical protein
MNNKPLSRQWLDQSGNKLIPYDISGVGGGDDGWMNLTNNLDSFIFEAHDSSWNDVSPSTIQSSMGWSQDIDLTGNDVEDDDFRSQFRGKFTGEGGTIEYGLETMPYDGTYVDSSGRLVINWVHGGGNYSVLQVQYIKSPDVGIERLKNSGEEANNTGGFITIVEG